jgi:hypothetical protein
MESWNTIATAAAEILFASVFIAGHRFHPFSSWIPDRRTIISFGAGMSSAYVFVHVMPELHGVRGAFVSSVSSPLPFEGMIIYFFALLGFLVFYGLDHLRTRFSTTDGPQNSTMGFRLHLGGFAIYIWLISYLLVNKIEDNHYSITLYVIAMTFHFLTVNFSLQEEYAAQYNGTGRFVLAAISVFGWAVGLLITLPSYVLAALMAFVSGGIIMNSSLMELPSEKDGRFWPFLAGGIFYGLILLPLG